MYLLVSILTALGLSVEASFLTASPVGVLGFGCWVSAFIISVVWLYRGKNITLAFSGLAASGIPLAFLGFGLWVAANGGV